VHGGSGWVGISSRMNRASPGPAHPASPVSRYGIWLRSPRRPCCAALMVVSYIWLSDVELIDQRSTALALKGLNRRQFMTSFVSVTWLPVPFATRRACPVVGCKSVTDWRRCVKMCRQIQWNCEYLNVISNLTDLLLVKIELLVKILCIFWFIVSFYIMYATYGWMKMNIKCRWYPLTVLTCSKLLVKESRVRNLRSICGP